MKKYKETYIIGIDHGYGNMKTANCCFQTGVTVYEKEPIFKDNLLVWNNKYYLIGAEHKEFSADKMLDEDYYVLTLAAIARELNIAKIYSADVLIAAGLPLTWVSEQRVLQIRENLMRVHHAEPPEEMITRVLRFGTADIDGDYLKTITNTAKEYVEGIFRRLREHGYDSKLMKLYIVGGGGCMIRNFAEYNERRITVNDDICATAKGYERMLEMKLIKNGGAL